MNTSQLNHCEDKPINSIGHLPFAHGRPQNTGQLKATEADFQVEELLGFEPEGSGEHHFLWVQKTANNTEFVARQLARFAQVSPRQVSYAGLKDRQALTRQWFSVQLPLKHAIDWSDFQLANVQILNATRHRKKLRRGVHQGNRFQLIVRQQRGDFEQLKQRAAIVAKQGVPNYFGEQRFGRDGANLAKARLWFEGKSKPSRHERSLFLSSVRAFLFNEVLAYRVAAENWANLLEGDAVGLDGSQSIFLYESKAADEQRPENGDEDAVPRRLEQGDIHPTGPLPGIESKAVVGSEVKLLEAAILKPHKTLIDGLLRHELKASRRCLRLIPRNFQMIQRDDETVECSFDLPRGAYATVVMREILQLQ